MRAGKLDRLLTVQRYVEGRNAYNEIEKQWVPLYPDVPASKRTQSGREALQAEQVVASSVTVFTIRYKAITAQDRILFEGRVYDIESLNEIGRRRGLEIITKGAENG